MTQANGVMLGSRDRIQNAYFEWMVGLVSDKKHRRLLMLLHETEFIYILEMDANRADDGVDLRYRFAYEFHYGEQVVDRYLTGPCSLLEMMVALALRCEESITDDPEQGNRTGEWFFEMIESLGLIDMDDLHFDKTIASDILNKFMRREYLPNGQGGLFTLDDPIYDLRKTEIWYQMMWYLSEKIYGRRRK